jgi:pimeloyl-ACP methyl ester carboxylesterase
LLEAARRNADFTLLRLKKEEETNCLPLFSEVNALYLSHSPDDYLAKVEEEKSLAESRRAAGKKKEVVVFVHGLGESRACWGLFPELLAREDVADSSLKKYYRVYVFQYATGENSWGVDDFKVDLIRFIDHIRETESVQKVTLIAHSYGGVLSLRYLIDSDPKTHKPYRDNVERFIGFAPSLHGSLVANAVVELFGRKQRRFQRELPPLFYQMPFTAGMGDLQIRQNQVGSDVNLTSFEALDKERSLEGIPALTVIGDPFKLFGFLAPGGSPEDDSLVKTYSANLNHRFLLGPSAQKDGGYSAAEVRYVNCDHYATIKAMDRQHAGYQYATSFLRGRLLPQMAPGNFKVKYFLAAVRIAAAGPANAGTFFLPRVQLSPMGDLILPAIRIEAIAPKGGGIHKTDWNSASCVYFVEGHVSGSPGEGALKLLLSGDGYVPKEVSLPVAGGRTTYAIGLTLEKKQK